MPAGPIGSVWGTGTWFDTVWEIGTWADLGVVITPPAFTRVRGLRVKVSGVRAVRVRGSS